MATLRDIRRRIRAVRNIQQITRAMYMVSAAKLKKAELQAREGRPYAAKLRELIARLAAAAEGYDHPLLARRDVRRVLLVVITSDRGLAGAYNANIIRLGQQVMREQEGKEILMLPVGRKARDFFLRHGVQFLMELTDLGEEIEFAEARRLARTCADAFVSGRVDEVILIYSQFLSAVSQRPRAEVLLPVAGVAGENGVGGARARAASPAEALAAGRAGTPGLGTGALSTVASGEGAPEPGEAGGYRHEYLFEPSVARILNELLPRYVETQVYRALMEAKASEHGARMTAMKNATDNAEELVDTLTLDLNRARQAAITKEIAEIVGGAEALKG